MGWGLIITAFALVFMASTARAVQLIETREAAVTYVDGAFAANGCRFRQQAFFEQMVRDGVAPGVDDMAQPMIGTDKIIRQRRILAALEALIHSGAVKIDAQDPKYAISKFGGCA